MYLIPPGAVADDEKQNVIRIGIGPYTDDLDGTAQALKAMLSRKGVEIDMLSRDLLSNYDPDSLDSPLRKALLSVDFLVVPVSDATPLLATTPGGHTASSKKHVLASAIRRASSGTGLIISKSALTSARLTSISKSSASWRRSACPSRPWPTSFFGAGAGKGLKIYIEDDFSESDDTPDYLLAQELELAWESLPPDPPRPQLNCAVLDWQQIQSADKDAAGVVLLLPAGRKNVDSLRAQISAVQQHLPKDAVVYPGCVALIFSPHRRPFPDMSGHSSISRETVQITNRTNGRSAFWRSF